MAKEDNSIALQVLHRHVLGKEPTTSDTDAQMAQTMRKFDRAATARQRQIENLFGPEWSDLDDDACDLVPKDDVEARWAEVNAPLLAAHVTRRAHVEAGDVEVLDFSRFCIAQLFFRHKQDSICVDVIHVRHGPCTQ